MAVQVFLCADLWKEESTLRAAYHDSLGVTEDFIKNGIQHALRSLGHGPAGDASLWDYNVSAAALAHSLPFRCAVLSLTAS